MSKKQTRKIKNCYHCPFSSGMGNTEIPPSFPTCEAVSERGLENLLHAEITDPTKFLPPNWCPLRKGPGWVRVELETVILTAEQKEKERNKEKREKLRKNYYD